MNNSYIVSNTHFCLVKFLIIRLLLLKCRGINMAAPWNSSVFSNKTVWTCSYHKANECNESQLWSTTVATARLCSTLVAKTHIRHSQHNSRDWWVRQDKIQLGCYNILRKGTGWDLPHTDIIIHPFYVWKNSTLFWILSMSAPPLHSTAWMTPVHCETRVFVSADRWTTETGNEIERGPSPRQRQFTHVRHTFSPNSFHNGVERKNEIKLHSILSSTALSIITKQNRTPQTATPALLNYNRQLTGLSVISQKQESEAQTSGIQQWIPHLNVCY